MLRNTMNNKEVVQNVKKICMCFLIFCAALTFSACSRYSYTTTMCNSNIKVNVNCKSVYDEYEHLYYDLEIILTNKSNNTYKNVLCIIETDIENETNDKDYTILIDKFNPDESRIFNFKLSKSIDEVEDVKIYYN